MFLFANHSNISTIANTTVLQENNGTTIVQENVRASPGLIYLSYITLPVVLVVGLCGNTLTLIVTRSKTYKTSFHGILIAAMAITDIAYLLTAPFNRQFVIDLFERDVRALGTVGCSIYFLFYRASKIFSAALVAIICLERFVLTWFPMKARSLTTPRAAVLSVSLCFLGTATFCGVWSVLADAKNDKCVPVVMTAENKLMAQSCSVIGMTLHSFIPTAVLLCFTPLTIARLCYQRSKRQMIMGNNKAGKDGGPDEVSRASLMLLGVIVSYMVLVTPFCMSKNVLVLTGINIASFPELWAINLYAVAKICEEVNCVINFFLYIFLNPSFRGHFRALFRSGVIDVPHNA